MKTEIIRKNNMKAAVIHSNELLITDVQSALDLIMTVMYEEDCTNIAVNKEAVAEDFFVLSTRLAGEILQKFINYRVKMAVYGDYSRYTSKPLKDFIYESNKGKDFFFVSTKEDAIQKLAQTQ